MGLTSLLFVLAASFLPLKAYSQCGQTDIPFTLTNSFTNKNWCVDCLGPWLRDSGSIFLDEEHNDFTFYCALDNIFSPQGKWTCAVIQTDVPSAECSLADIDDETVIIHSSVFCLGSQFGATVDLDVSSDGTINVNWFPPPCATSVSSFLGDNFKHEKSKPDTDIFLFDGIEADAVKLTLEADPQAGNNGGNASLGINGNSLNEASAGTLPLEIKTTLPADGEYSIIVEQPRISEEQRFRGSYMLSLESSAGVDLIKPTNNVEK